NILKWLDLFQTYFFLKTSLSAILAYFVKSNMQHLQTLDAKIAAQKLNGSYIDSYRIFVKFANERKNTKESKEITETKRTKESNENKSEMKDDDPIDTKKAFQNLAFSKFKKLPLFLEWAPIDIFDSPNTSSSIQNSNSKDSNYNSEFKQAKNHLL
ncbi:RNA binding motif protein, partial [Reticulomyxa filosa]